jgi:hypothetical protein
MKKALTFAIAFEKQVMQTKGRRKKFKKSEKRFGE